MHTYKQLTYIVIFALLFVGAVSVQAQTEVRTNTTQETEVRADSDTDEKCEVGDDCPEDEVEGANYNNSRSNRANVAPDGDLDGDGYGDVQMRERCDDGVCTEVREAGEFEAGESESTEANYNNSRSNRSTVVGEEDSDTDYNNNRSNRSTVAGDDEANDLPEEASKGITKALDKASPKLMQALRIDEDSPLMGDGVELRLQGDACEANDEDCDDDGVSTDLSPRDMSLRVSGATVRGWNPDQKAELTRRLQAAGTSTTANDFGMRVAQAAIGNDNVTEITTNNEVTEVRFQTQLQLFGFIPTQANATARADADGAVEVDYPWYGFLASKGDSSIFSSLAAELRAAHEVMISVEEEGAPRTIRSDAQEN